MYKLCKTEQSAQRQRQLEDGLLDAMLQQRYEDISISDLCDQLQVPRKSFYRYFASKDGALHALIDHRLLEFEMLTSSKSSRTSHGELNLLMFYEFWYSQKRLLDALSRSGLSNVLAERSIELSCGSEKMGYYTLRTHKNIRDVAITFVTSGLMTLVIQWHRDGFQESPREMAEITQLLLAHPLVPGIRLH